MRALESAWKAKCALCKQFSRFLTILKSLGDIDGREGEVR